MGFMMTLYSTMARITAMKNKVQSRERDMWTCQDLPIALGLIGLTNGVVDQTTTTLLAYQGMLAQ